MDSGDRRLPGRWGAVFQTLITAPGFRRYYFVGIVVALVLMLLAEVGALVSWQTNLLAAGYVMLGGVLWHRSPAAGLTGGRRSTIGVLLIGLAVIIDVLSEWAGIHRGIGWCVSALGIMLFFTGARVRDQPRAG